VSYLELTYNVKKNFMKLNKNLQKVKKYKLDQDKLRNNALKQGVNLIAPETIFLSKDTKFGKNITIEPYVVVRSKVKIGNNVIIKSFSHIEGATIEKNAIIGPYARLRPGTVLKEGAKIGNFVETKKSTIGNNSKVNHLSYIGDTTIGQNSNIGAGTITCNYNGINKNKTIISDNVFIGSNTSLVAPIKINKSSVVGAGSVITKNVNSNSLALTRTKQTEIKNYKRKKRK
jgi:UDP-N-acetylglucosamine diphosphorylase/glucosamine-1-phosphate N-acetyltransferase